MKIKLFDKDLYHYYRENHWAEIEAAGLTMDWVNPKELTLDEEAQVLISGRVKGENLKYLPNLKVVIVPYTGLNGLDLEALGKAEVRIMNTSAHAIFVAERTVALLLALKGNLMVLHNNLKRGFWSKRYEDDRMSWHSIYDSKVAIYGYGTIGREVARLLEPFRPEIGILDYKNRSYKGVQTFDTLGKMASWCDILIVTAPLTEYTRNSIDYDILSLMRGKYLVNVGRGDIVEEKAIYDRLVDGTLAGFASDVWYTYPQGSGVDCPPSRYPIHELDNVVMTPHNAGFEATAAAIRYQDVLRQIIAYKEAIG